MNRPFAPLLHRLAAALIDLTFNTVCIGLGLSLGGAIADPDTVNDTILLGGLVGWMIGWGTNYAFLQGVHGASLGKQLLKLKVVREDGTPLGIWFSLYRSYTYFASAMPIAGGFLTVFVDVKDQCWHDRICRTVVIRKDAQYPMPSLGSVHFAA
jgi:uncharacterized RDD family membrane protein YckC